MQSAKTGKAVWAVQLWCMVWAVVVAAACTPLSSRDELSDRRPVRFVAEVPAARTVAVTGSFNGWSITAHPMEPDGETRTWSVEVMLPSGEHRYMYVIDGQRWMTPHSADDFVPDGFGQVNGVVIVR